MTILFEAEPNLNCKQLQTVLGNVCGCPYPKPAAGECTICADGVWKPPKPDHQPLLKAANSTATCHFLAATLQRNIDNGNATCEDMQTTVGIPCGCKPPGGISVNEGNGGSSSSATATATGACGAALMLLLLLVV